MASLCNQIGQILTNLEYEEGVKGYTTSNIHITISPEAWYELRHERESFNFIVMKDYSDITFYGERLFICRQKVDLKIEYEICCCLWDIDRDPLHPVSIRDLNQTKEFELEW